MFGRIFVWVLAGAIALFPALAFAQSSPLPGFPPGVFQSRAAIDASSGVTPATCTFEAFATENAGTSTATFTSVALGAAASNRVIAVIPMARTTTAPNASVTGVALTVGATATLSQVSGAFANPGSGQVMASDVWSASVPSGTTATITVTWSAANTRSAVYVYVITTTTPTPAHGANTTGLANTTLTQSITVPTNGCAIAGFTTQQTGDTLSFTAGATLDQSNAMAGGNGTAAGHTTTTGSVSITASALSTANVMTLSLASWGP